MNVVILGAGMMGRAIAYDLSKFSNFDEILLGEKDSKTRASTRRFLQETRVKVIPLDAERTSEMKNRLQKGDVIISALPYRYNYRLAQRVNRFFPFPQSCEQFHELRHK